MGYSSTSPRCSLTFTVIGQLCPRAAAAIASTGAGTRRSSSRTPARPGAPASTCRWRCAPRERAAAAHQRRLDRVVDQLGHDLARRAGVRGRTGVARIASPMPTDVALTTRSAVAIASASADRPDPSRRAPPPTRRVPCAVDHADRAARRPGPARGPPPGRHRRRRAPRTTPGRVEAEVVGGGPRRSRPRRCCRRRAAVVAGAMQFTAPSAAAVVGETRRAHAITSALWGIVTDRPADAERSHARSTARRRTPAGTGRAT